MEKLNTVQEKAAAELARNKGESCLWCGSALYLAVADPRPQPHHAGGAEVMMSCDRDPHPLPAPESPWRVRFTREELRSIYVGR